MNEQRKLLSINIGIIISFILVKFLLRPFVLRHEFPELYMIFVLSYPNFCEAVARTLVVTYLMLIVNNRLFDQKKRIKKSFIYGAAVIYQGFMLFFRRLKFIIWVEKMFMTPMMFCFRFLD